jgi:hypothetical protein
MEIADDDTDAHDRTLSAKTAGCRRCGPDTKGFPRWEIPLYGLFEPWPYPDNGAENYVNNVALPDMAKGIAWFWSIRRREVPDELMGIICV